MLSLFVAESGTARTERWLAEDPNVIVWTLTRVELLSAMARRRREEPGTIRRLRVARRELLAAWERWSEVTAFERASRHAERLVETHPQRAADALQIGAAMAATDDPSTLDFVTLDARQAAAAEREGFRVLGPG